MKRTAAAAAGVVAILIGADTSAAHARPAPVTAVSATISCATNTSATVIITPVDASDYTTGAPLSVGCGQYSPTSASETVTAGTTQWNYSGFFYPIGATSTTSLLGRVRLGRTVRASTKRAEVSFSLTAA